MGAGVIIFGEQREGNLKSSTIESASVGKDIASQIGGELSVVLIGSGVSGMVNDLSEYGIDKIYLAESDDLIYYDGGRYSSIFSDAVRKSGASVVLAASSSMGKDLMPRSASELGAGLATDCTAVEVVDGKVVATRPVYAGKANAKVGFNSEIKMLTLRPNVFPAKTSDHKEPELIAIEVGEKKEPVLKVEAADSERPELTEASIIVSGGRGMGGPENFHITEGLADKLGAAVGASRAVVDAGWRPHSEQVGQTGKTVSPNLYIACGISGAIQHLAGMSSSKVIVAVNKDPEAPIFKVATYGIVGDLFEIIPKMVEEIDKLNG